MSITELQRTVWENCAYESVATQKIRNQALVYYCEYKEHLKKTHSFIESENKIQNLMLISFFISEKSEILHDVQGNKINNIAFSINQLVKKHSDYKEFFYHMKEMMRTVNLPKQAKQSEQEINSFMKYFSFVMTFYNKFLSTFEKINICHNIHAKDMEWIGGEIEYKNSIKYLLWGIYICFRKNKLKSKMDTIANTCLLACLFSYFVKEIYKQDKVTSIYSPDIVKDLGTFPNEYHEIEEICLEYFCLTDLKNYQQVRKVFLKFIDNLTTNLPDFEHPFSLKSVSLNIKKLQQMYHKGIDTTQIEIDETLFLKNLASNQSSIRFTAFGANRKIKHYHSNNMFQCRRALNYETEIKNSELILKNKHDCIENLQNPKGNYIDVMKKIKASLTPVILIKATPVTQFANAYNWLHKKSLVNSQSKISLDLETLLKIGYKEELFQLRNEEILEKKHLIEGLFYELLEQYTEQNQENINVASILALEVFSYVMNISTRDISQIVDALNIFWFSVWEGVHMLLNYDKTMPINVKTHLLLLQTSIVSSFIWKEQEFVESLSTVTLSYKYPQFFNRVLHHMAYQLHFICKAMNIPDILMDQAFVVCQFYLKECSPMMQDTNLDLVIMCAIYGVCRAKNQGIKFKEMISVYKNMNNMSDKAFQAIQVFEDSDSKDFNIIKAIINLYNSQFLPNCKSILMKLKDELFIDDENINSTNYVLSPVKSILPAALMSRRNAHGTPNNSQMLLAYNESPLLKRNKSINANQHYLSNKQNIEGNNLYSKKNIYNQSEVLRQRSNNVSQMLQQKFGNHKKSTLIPKSFHQKQLKSN